MLWEIDVVSPYADSAARLTMSVAAGLNMNPIPAPAHPSCQVRSPAAGRPDANPPARRHSKIKPIAATAPPMSTTTAIPRLSKSLAPNCDATRKPTKNARISPLACPTFKPSESWPYTLTKYMSGTKTAEATSVASVERVKALFAKALTSTTGRAMRRSNRKKHRKRTSEPPKLARIRGSDQPTSLPFFSGKIRRTIATAAMAAPVQSIVRSEDFASRRSTASALPAPPTFAAPATFAPPSMSFAPTKPTRTRPKAIRAKGRLTKKMYRHEY